MKVTDAIRKKSAASLACTSSGSPSPSEEEEESYRRVLMRVVEDIAAERDRKTKLLGKAVKAMRAGDLRRAITKELEDNSPGVTNEARIGQLETENATLRRLVLLIARNHPRAMAAANRVAWVVDIDRALEDIEEGRVTEWDDLYANLRRTLLKAPRRAGRR